MDQREHTFALFFDCICLLKGRIEFGPNGERKYARTEVLVKQYQRLVKGRDQNKSFEQVNVGLYSDGNLSLLGDALLWPSKFSVIDRMAIFVIFLQLR